MAIRKIITVGDETLRQKSRKIEKINERIRILLEDMADTLNASDTGVGLAAPQVGVLRQAVLIDIGEGKKYFINPEILSSEGSCEVEESCLSVPGTSGTLTRPKKVTVRALDENGKEFTLEAEGIMAVCLCHEIDHLNGVLFIDRIKDYL